MMANLSMDALQSGITNIWHNICLTNAHKATKLANNERSLNGAGFYNNIIKSFPKLDQDAEAYLGQMMDNAREQMMVAAFGTKAGASIIMKQLSAFCDGQLKLKDLIGFCQLEDDEREESAETLKTGFEQLNAVISDERPFDEAKKNEVVALMQGMDLGMDFVQMVVTKLQALWTSFKNSRKAWTSHFGFFCTEAEILKSMKQFKNHKKNDYICTKEQYTRLANAYEAYEKACNELTQTVGDLHEFEATMNIINTANEHYNKAREILTTCNLYLVHKLVRHFSRSNMLEEDLVQEGTIGLMRAVEKYDYRLGNKFCTYATWWIKQSLTRAVADQSRTVRVPIHLVDVINRINKAAAEIENELGHEASSAEIAEKLSMATNYVDQMRLVGKTNVHIDAPINDEDDSTFGDIIEDKNSSTPIDNLSVEDLAVELSRVLSTLSEREERILRLRYGIGYDRSYTLEEVGHEFNLTRERIRQIEVRAVQKLLVTSEMSDLALFL